MTKPKNGRVGLRASLSAGIFLSMACSSVALAQFDAPARNGPATATAPFKAGIFEAECSKPQQGPDRPLAPLAMAEGRLKVAFLYVGNNGPLGWTREHDAARMAVQGALGNRATLTGIENVPESLDAERVIADLIAKGTNVIVGTSYGYMQPLHKYACMHKDVRFLHASGSRQRNNLQTYDSRNYEGVYLAGMMAGRMTRSNVLGVVAPIPIPEAIRDINAFTLGARSVNPNVRVRVEWSNDWDNAAKDTNSTNALIAAGADILLQSTASMAVGQIADRANKRYIGMISDWGAPRPAPVPARLGEQLGIVTVSRCIALAMQERLGGSKEVQGFYADAARAMMVSTQRLAQGYGDAVAQQVDYVQKVMASPGGGAALKPQLDECAARTRASESGRKSHLVSVKVNWAPYYSKVLTEVLDNKWSPNQNTWWGMKEGVVDIATVAPDVPGDVQSRVRDVRDAMKQGRFAVFKGPLEDQSGREVLRNGQIADDRLLEGMSFYVRGVEGRVPGAR